MIKWILPILLLGVQWASAASWYFDNIAFSGNNKGTNWANAWTNSASIDWMGAGIQPGDTLWVSGGSSTNIYTSNIVIQAYGTTDNYIRIRIGQDAGHNGVAEFTNSAITTVNSRPKWIWIDGGRDTNFVAPTNHQQVVRGTTAITNNIGFVFRDIWGTNDADTSPIVWFLRNPDSMKVSWVKVSGLTNTGNFEFNSTRGSVCYIDMSSETNDAATNNIFEYMCLERNMGQQFAKVETNTSGFDDFIFRFGWINLGGEDHFEVGSGWTIHDSVLGPCYPNGVHNDYFQFTGSYFKVYNNDIRESQNAIMRVQTPGAGGFATSMVHSIWFYNNLVTEKQGRALGGGTLVEPFCFVHIDSGHPSHMTIISNVVFANNLIYNSVLSTAVEPGDEMCRNSCVYFQRGAQVTNSQVKAITFVNNLIVDKHQGTLFPYSTNFAAAQTYWAFTTNDVVCNYNVFAGTNTSLIQRPRHVGYMDVYTNIEIHPFQFLNRSNYPSFASVASDNYELLGIDQAGLNRGSNMSAWFTTDALNRPRNVSGAWDIGPLEAQETNLVVFLSFDSDAAGGNALDSSGNGFDGKRFNLTEYSYPSNRTASALAGTTFRPNITGNAADFLWRTNDGVYNPTYGDDGSFFGITNAMSRLTNMSRMTVMCWARYQNANRTDIASPDSSDEANAQLICGGGTAKGTKGSWFLGRYNQRINQNNTRFVVQTNEGFSGGTSFGTVGDPVIGYGSGNQVFFEFPDRGFDQNGNTTNWYHYAVTFSSGVVNFYFNGVRITNHTLSTVSTLTMGGSSTGRPFNWVGIGVNTHEGTPEFENESGTDYPNNGWLNGALDQVRIYDRALSWQEIVDVANSEGAQFADAPEAPATTNTVTAVMLRGKVSLSGRVGMQ